jgi:hypothetical protein
MALGGGSDIEVFMGVAPGRGGPSRSLLLCDRECLDALSGPHDQSVH